ncbi:MAG: c-type cytochrome [Saprospiraceae bacterium]|nr:c-type cytochrome [Saprospiraceae bacterium]
MIYKSLLIRLPYLILCIFLSVSAIAQPSPDAGKTIFRNQCASCHNRNMTSDMTGPALGAVSERWAAYPESDLYAWIRNSSALVESGHPRAIEVYNQYNKIAMTPFPNLTDDDIGSLLLYIDGTFNGTYGVPVAGPVASTGQTDSGSGGIFSGNSFYYIIFGFLIILSLVLTRVLNKLKYLTDIQEGVETEGPRSLWSSLTSKGIVGIVIFSLIVLGGYFTVNNAIGLNRMQEYQPDQPIKFSHTTHAGLNKIDCQYCHDGARRSKHSIIPATNTCMNCHKAIKVGSKFGTAELTKIYASIGYDPTKDVYIENYDQLGEDDLKKVYTAWIANQYVLDNGKLDRKGERLMEDQWEGIKSSLTSETKPQIQGPIEWIRIHNLPDHVYFNHAQHVTVGKLACQQCHGKVEEMEVVKQYAPLSMGWCINCHRETDVKFTDNPYYTSYAKYHEEIQAGTRSRVTVEEIGGLECQKCHY